MFHFELHNVQILSHFLRKNMNQTEFGPNKTVHSVQSAQPYNLDFDFGRNESILVEILSEMNFLCILSGTDSSRLHLFIREQIQNIRVPF